MLFSHVLFRRDTDRIDKFFIYNNIQLYMINWSYMSTAYFMVIFRYTSKHSNVAGM